MRHYICKLKFGYETSTIIQFYLKVISQLSTEIKLIVVNRIHTLENKLWGNFSFLLWTSAEICSRRINF